MRRFVHVWIVFLVVQMPSFYGAAQTSMERNWLPGYARSVHGGGFSYHSPDPEVRSSLLIRSISSKDYIEWESALAPASRAGDTLFLIWMYGMDANMDRHRWSLQVNGVTRLEFFNPTDSEKKNSLVPGSNGVSLSFRPIFLDKYDDPMGYAVLTLPPGTWTPGRSQVLRISGENASSNTWYMTFESAIGKTASIRQPDALLKGPDGPSMVVNCTLNHLGEPGRGRIIVKGLPSLEIVVQPGFNSYELRLPAVRKPKKYTARILIDGEMPQDISFQVKPIREWSLFLVQHAHTDIGYTRPQTEILPEHLRYIDFALDYCDQTDNLPPEARFHWTCETSWAVGEYLKSRPENQIVRLRKRVEEGRIELAGLFLNLSDLYNESLLAQSFEPVTLARELEMPVRVAMQNDVNGIPWCLADYMEGAGIRYLSLAQNTHRARKPFDVPTLFWWESPSGKRVLTFRNEHYMTGNTLGLLSQDLSTLERSLFPFLADLMKRGYPGDALPIQFSGFNIDNSPPSTLACQLVQAWNEKYEWPRLKLSGMEEFFSYEEEKLGSRIPVFRKAWPDWWSDGFGSTARETAQARLIQSDFVNTTGLLAAMASQGVEVNEHGLAQVREIADNLIFWNEHTFTAAESISDPDCENTRTQWAQKQSYVWSALKQNSLLRDQALGLAREFLPTYQVPGVAVFNSLNQARTGIATIFINQQNLPRQKRFKIVDDEMNEMPCQLLRSREEGAYWALGVQQVPPGAFSTYRVLASYLTANPVPEAHQSTRLENRFFRIEVDTLRGCIRSLYDKELGRELVDSGGNWGFGVPVYERLGHNRSQLEQLRLEDFTRTAWTNCTLSPITRGPLWNAMTLTGRLDACADEQGIIMEIRLFNHEKRVELHFSMRKRKVTDPEGLYVAFPFAMANFRMGFDVQGGWVDPSRDQMEGASSDWNVAQTVLSVAGQNSAILFSSPEVPLFMAGDINLGQFRRKSVISTPHVYSWVLNNYWTTNFLASQDGSFSWHYAITSAPDTSRAYALRWGREQTIPLLGTVIAPGANRRPTRGFDSPAFSEPGLQLVQAIPVAVRSVVYQFREEEGRTHSLDFRKALDGFRYRRFFEVDVTGQPVYGEESPFTIKPLEQRFFRVDY